MFLTKINYEQSEIEIAPVRVLVGFKTGILNSEIEIEAFGSNKTEALESAINKIFINLGRMMN